MNKKNELSSTLLPAVTVSDAEINICDIIDLEFLQKFQDAFGKAFGMAGLSTDKNGNPITEPTNFTEFCMRLTRGSHKGLEGCMRSDAKGGAESAATGKPAVYFCDNGLMDFGAPIILNGKQIGSILGGQVLPGVPDEEKFREIAADIGVDPEEYVAALRKVRIVPEEQVRAAADLLFVVASEISKTGYQRYVLKQMIEELNQNLLQMTATMQQFSASAATVTHYQNTLNQEIQEVNSRSEEINEVLESIKEVANETRLLGLNAAIEAAKAGEYGLGFGVVAEEIRKLSTESKNTVTQIRNFTSQIKQSVQKTAAMGENTLSATKEQEQSIKHLVEMVGNISNYAQRLNTVIDE